MLNEFSYCPRLFFLEWVEARFAGNDDTADGAYAHRAVDQPGGAAPLATDPGPLRRVTSLHLSSATLGLTAAVDTVEGDGDEVVPVDTKKGSPPDTPERSWEPERIQLCVQGLLLRDAGYTCNRGELYFATTRERVEVTFTAELIGRTQHLLGELRGSQSGLRFLDPWSTAPSVRAALS